MSIEMSGYVSEILCGYIPEALKETFTQYVLQKRDDTVAPPWMTRRNPSYVSPEFIKKIWYEEKEIMEEIARQSGTRWTGYRDVNNLCHRLGFGSGKQGLGLFEIGVFMEGRPLLEFVPFEPHEVQDRLKNMERIRARWMEAEPLPLLREGYVAVSAGSWAKGTMVFETSMDGAFDADRLELLLLDLTNLGVGEDHYVAGLRYAGEPLPGRVVRQTQKEMYPLLWYCPETGKWLDMYETA